MALPRLDAIDALLLDLDDTILDDRTGIRAAWDSVAAMVVRSHPDWTIDDVRTAIVEVTDWFWSDPERERVGRLDLLEARRRILEGVMERLGRADPDLVEATARHYTEERVRTQRMADGAGDALERLRARLPKLAIVTNGAAVPQRAKLERFELSGYFDHIQVEGEFGLGKPEPAVYEHVSARLRVPVARCLMVGDNYRCDVLGALAVGMHAAWIDVEGRGQPPRPATRPHATVASLVELTERLLDDARGSE